MGARGGGGAGQGGGVREASVREGVWGGERGGTGERDKPDGWNRTVLARSCPSSAPHVKRHLLRVPVEIVRRASF